MADDARPRPGRRATRPSGGGSASALAGAMAAGLLGMVARLSVGRGLELERRALPRVRRRGRRASAPRCSPGAADDAEAYGLVKAAYGLPQETTRRRQAARQAAIHDALIAAAYGAARQRPPRCCASSTCAASSAAVPTPRRPPTSPSPWCSPTLRGTAALLNVDVNVGLLPGVPAAARLRRRGRGAAHRATARTSAPLKESA